MTFDPHRADALNQQILDLTRRATVRLQAMHADTSIPEHLFSTDGLRLSPYHIY